MSCFDKTYQQRRLSPTAFTVQLGPITDNLAYYDQIKQPIERRAMSMGNMDLDQHSACKSTNRSYPARDT